MAERITHFSFSVCLALLFVAFFWTFSFMNEEVIGIASVMVVFGGMFPNIDHSAKGGGASLIGLISAILVLLGFNYWEAYIQTSTARMIIAAIIIYSSSFFVLTELFERYSKRRGVSHSLLCAILLTQICYFLFFDLQKNERLLVSSAFLLGYLVHLGLDSLSRKDIDGKVLDSEQKGFPILRFGSKSMTVNAGLFFVVSVLGLLIAGDFFPEAKELQVSLLGK